MDKLLRLVLLINSRLGSLIYPRWKIELIDKESILYRRVFYLKINRKSYTPEPSSFEDFDLSCDWNKFSTPESSLNLIGKEYKFTEKVFKNPNEYFICSILVSDILHVNHKIVHNPLQSIYSLRGHPRNRAHSLIIGDKKSEDEKTNVKIRLLLSKKSKWEIFDENKLDELKQKHKAKNN